MSVRILQGDCREVLVTLPDESVHCCVTSPPYFGLRSYLPEGHPDKEREIGLEPTPDAYVAELVGVFREVRRVLRTDGTLWLNLGDSYANDGKWGGHTGGKHAAALHCSPVGRNKRYTGLKPKDLIGIPWMVAFALRADGWFLRSDVIWAKPNAMPESVLDRPTRAHEYLFLLSKSRRYFYDAAAIREPPSRSLLQQIEQGYAGADTKDFAGAGAQSASGTKSRVIAGARAKIDKQRGHGRRHHGFNERWDVLTKQEQQAIGSNKRSVWTVATASYPGPHYATFPPALIEPCIKAGCPIGGTVLDPFGGAGTTGLIADRLQRSAILIELNSADVERSNERIASSRGALLDAMEAVA